MGTQIYQTYSFLPTKISGCQLWLDGADLSTLFTNEAGTTPVSASGQSVAFWKDKSTQANNATNSANQPTVTYSAQNGLSVVTFNGTSQFLNLTPSKLPNGSTNFSYFFVVRTSSSAVQVFMANGTTVTNQMPQFYFSNYALVGDLFGGSSTSDGTTYNNQFVVASYTGSSTFTGYDFDSSFSGAAASVSLNTGTTWALLGVSRTVTPSPSYVFYLSGQIAEVIVYNRVVSTSEREQLQAYLGWKWDLEANFTSGFTYKNNPPFMNTIQLPITPTRPIQVSNTPPFLPSQISGLQLWFDAADSATLTISGSNITRWNDKSSNAYSIAQASATRQPFYLPNAQNGLPAVQLATARWIFTESSNIPNFTTSAATSVFIAARNGTTGTTYNAINSVRLVAGTISATSRYQIFFDGNTDTTLRGVNAAIFSSPTNAQLRNSTNIVPASTSAVVGFTADSTTLLLSVNGNTSSTGGVPLTSSSDGTYFQFGDSRGFATISSDVRVYEMVGYSVALTTAQRQQVEGYLAWKWGTQGSLPTTHPYYKSPFPNMSMAPTPAFPPQIRSVSWQPSNIAGLQVWLDGLDTSTMTFSGATVLTWKSKGSATITASSVGAGQIQYQTYQNRKSLYFNGTNTKMTTESISSYGASATTWISASVNLNPSTGDASVVIATTNSPERAIRYTNGEWQIYTFNNGVLRGTRNKVSGVRGFIDTAPSCITYVNGVDVTSTSQAVTYEAGANQTFVLGQWNVAYLNGYIQEICIFDSALSLKQYQQVEGYLAWKWGFQGDLPSTHPYKLFPPPP